MEAYKPINKNIQEFNYPKCLKHPTERLVRICINTQCQKYFEPACQDCLDQHNHNIQELIKLKDFFQTLEEQSEPLPIQTQLTDEQTQNLISEKKITQSKKSTKDEEDDLAQFEVLSLGSNQNDNDEQNENCQQFEKITNNTKIQDEENENFENVEENYQKEKTAAQKNKPQSEQVSEKSIKIEQINNLQNYIQHLEKQLNFCKNQLETLNQELVEESKTTPQSQVRNILTSILSANCDKLDGKQELLYTKIKELSQYVIKNNQSQELKIASFEKQKFTTNISIYCFNYNNQLKIVDKEISNLQQIVFRRTSEGENCLQRFIFSQKLKGSQPQLNFQDKGVWQKGNEDRFILMEPKLNINDINRWALKINDSGSWSGVGIAQKDIIQKEAYQFTKYTGNGKHGSFLVSNNGYSWNYLQENQNMQINGFTFSTGDVLLLEYNPQLKKLLVISQQNKKIVGINMDKIDPNQEYHPCVNICSGASIKIIDDYIWPDIETLKSYKIIGVNLADFKY